MKKLFFEAHRQIMDNEQHNGFIAKIKNDYNLAGRKQQIRLHRKHATKTTSFTYSYYNAANIVELPLSKQLESKKLPKLF